MALLKNGSTIDGYLVIHVGNIDTYAESKFTKNTAFNKNFGTSAGAVSEGNHTHTLNDINETADKKILTNTERTNIQNSKTHTDSPHAPSNAQKNSDITKAEIEAKLTGVIGSHYHSQYLLKNGDSVAGHLEFDANIYPIYNQEFTIAIKGTESTNAHLFVAPYHGRFESILNAKLYFDKATTNEVSVGAVLSKGGVYYAKKTGLDNNDTGVVITLKRTSH